MKNSTPTLRQRLESLPTWALILLCAIYCISPIDAMPFVPIDDFFVFGWTVYTIVKRLGARRGVLPGTTPESTGPTAANP